MPVVPGRSPGKQPVVPGRSSPPMLRAMRSTSTLAAIAFALLAIVAAAGVAALAAHVTIDIAANFFVAHDPYDDIEHRSRFWFLGGSLAIAAAGALAVLVAALKDFQLGES